MFEITDDSIIIESKPNFLIKLSAYFLLPLGLLLLGVMVWELFKGRSPDVQIILTCLTCLAFGGYAATVLNTRSYRFDKRAKNIVIGWGKDIKTFQFADVSSFDAFTNRNWVTIGMTLKATGYSQIYVFPHNGSSRGDGKKLLAGLSETVGLQPQLDASAEKWFEL